MDILHKWQLIYTPITPSLSFCWRLLDPSCFLIRNKLSIGWSRGKVVNSCLHSGRNMENCSSTLSHISKPDPNQVLSEEVSMEPCFMQSWICAKNVTLGHQDLYILALLCNADDCIQLGGAAMPDLNFIINSSHLQISQISYMYLACILHASTRLMCK